MKILVTGAEGFIGSHLVERLVKSNHKVKAKKLLRWKPKYVNKKGLVLGLKKTIEWFANFENTKNYKPDNYNI